MKLKLKVTKSELEALIKIAGVFVKFHAINPGSVMTHSYVAAFENFLIRQLKHLSPLSKKERTITMTDMETLAFFNFCEELMKGDISPFEYAVSIKIVGAAALQMDNEVTLRMSMKNV